MQLSDWNLVQYGIKTMVIGIWKRDYMKVNSKIWLIKWLQDVGNVIMKFESLKLKWF